MQEGQLDNISLMEQLTNEGEVKNISISDYQITPFYNILSDD